MKAAIICPVCMGNGLVPDGFYRQTSGKITSSTIEPEKCRSCNGKGYVLIEDEKIVIKEEINLSNRDYVQKIIVPELIKTLKSNSPKTNIKDIIGIY